MKNVSIVTKVLFMFLILCGLATLSFLHLLRKTYEQSLISQGRSLAQQIIIFRKWCANYGGVWSKDKYLKKYGFFMEMKTPKGDISSEEGEQLIHVRATSFYLHNPALATRELSGCSERSYGWTFRVVSEKYMGAHSKPDKFESSAIAAMTKSKKGEYWGWEGGQFRFAKAIYIEKGCLKCHGKESEVPDVIKKALYAKYGNRVFLGYKIGDLRGIISVILVPESIISKAASSIDIINVGALLISFVLFWLFAKRAITQPIEKLTRVAHSISVGDLDADTGVHGLKESEVKDEIIRLAIAIERLKKSVQIAIRRLRDRKLH